MPESPCPGCGELLDVPPEFADRPIRCGGCQRVLQPHEHSPRPAARGGRPPEDPPWRGDDRPRPRRMSRDPDADAPAKPRSTTWVWLLFAVGGFGACCCGGGLVVLSKAANPDWASFSSPGNEFTADFPGPPAHTTETTTWGKDKTTTTDAYNATHGFRQEWFTVQLTPLPDELPKGKEWDDHILNAWLFTLKNGQEVGFKEESRKAVTVNGVAGKEVEGSLSDRKLGTGRLVVRVFVLGDKLLLQGAVLKKDTPQTRADLKRFLDSLQLTPPPEKEKDKKDKPKKRED